MNNRYLIKHIILTIIFFLTATLVNAQQALEIIPAPPQLAAKSYVLMDAATGQILINNDGDERLPPASLTKLMTAYLATLEMKKGQVRPADLVTISEKAWKTGGSKMFVEVGKQVSLGDLLHGIIIQSGNDASVAVSEYLAGSEDVFAELMNKTAAQLGMKNSHFMNATGLPDPNHFSSAHDMAILARAIIYEDPAHYAIYSQKEFLWNKIKQPNRNLLLWRDSTVDGLKTGHTEEAGYCMVASAKRNNLRLIAVLFGTSSEKARAEETQKLLTYGFRFYENRTLYKKGVEVKKIRVWKGTNNEVSTGFAEDLSITLLKNQFNNIQLQVSAAKELMAPVVAGQVLGKVVVKVGDKIVYSTDLVALQTVEQGSFLSRIWDSIVLFFKRLFS